MTNIFVTRKVHDLEPIEKKVIVDSLGRSFPVDGEEIHDNEIIVTDSLDGLYEMLRNGDEFGLDTENSSLNQFYAIPLLLQIGVPGLSYVIDRTSIFGDILQGYEDKLYIGHNVQYDYRIMKYLYGTELRRLKDTMVSAQIINRGSGRFNNLEDEYFRRTSKRLPEDKNTRNDFRYMTEKSIFKRKHIVYSGFDPQACLEIYPIQEEVIKRYNLEHRYFNIALPLIPILGDMNLIGRTLNKEKWRENLDENRRDLFKLELEMDAIIKEFAKDNIKLRGGIWSSASRTRKKESGEQTGLFGTGISISTEAKKNVSYNSTDQMAKLFKILKEPLPEKEDDKAEKDWNEPVMKVSFDEPTLEQYMIMYPGSRMIPFIKLLVKYKVLRKEIDSFGEIFLQEYVKDGKTGKKFKRGYYQPKTDKIHTIYKQEFTANGRLSSGGDKKKKGDLGVGFDNSQNWPKKPKFRNCITLTEEEIRLGIWMSTLDLRSAELVILADKSKDPNLIKYCREDLHSYLATHSYSNIVQYILNGRMNENRAYDELWQLLKVNRLQKEYKIQYNEDSWRFPTKQEEDAITKERVELAISQRSITIDKKKHPDLREPYKNVTYGYLYGAADDKIAKTLNIAPHYAHLVNEGIGIAVPQANSYLNAMARIAVKQGYIEANNRTHSRHWFKSWLDAREWGKQLTNGQRGAIERFAKNYTMSATQADMIKEGMVEIDKFVRQERIYFHFLMQVHDELVFKHQDKDLRPEIEKILIKVCNLYLSVIEMEVAGYTGTFWHKN